ncbi:MAG: hypothetical protein PWQ10_285 [Patescibacteria group bacterium]|nr:hypothetical protein [Patescibacteria group bacterium]
MATAKKSTKKSPAKKKVSVNCKKEPEFKSFKLSKEQAPFMSFRITKQTVYWTILLIYIMVLVLWITRIQLETLQIINNIVVA